MMAEESNGLQKIAHENTDNGGHFDDLINNEIKKLDISAVSVQVNELTLIDVGSLDEEENMWLSPSGSPLTAGIEKEWLKDDLDLTGVTVEKNTLVDMLDDISRKSQNSPKSPANSENSERSIMSPPILASVYLCSPMSSTPTSTPLGCKLKIISPKELQGGRIIAEETDINSTTSHEDGDQPLNSTFKIKENMNSTLDNVPSPTTSLNSTFNKDSPLTGLNSTFSKDEVTNLNSTFAKEGNATFNTAENMNATFETINEKEKFDMKATREEEEMSRDSSSKEGEGSTNPSMDDGVPKPSDSSENLKSSIVQDSSHDTRASLRILDNKPGLSKTQLSKIRPPPSSRLYVPPSFRYKTPILTAEPPPRPAIVGGLLRGGLRPPTSVLRKTTVLPKTGSRPPTVAPGKSLKPPTSVQVRQVRPLTTSARGKSLRPATSLPENGPRPSTSVAVTGLKKPSGIVRPPGVVARPSGLARPTGSGIAMPSNARPIGSGIAMTSNGRPTGGGIAMTSNGRPTGGGIAMPSNARPTGSGIAIASNARKGQTVNGGPGVPVADRTASGSTSRLVTG